MGAFSQAFAEGGVDVFIQIIQNAPLGLDRLLLMGLSPLDFVWAQRKAQRLAPSEKLWMTVGPGFDPSRGSDEIVKMKLTLKALVLGLFEVVRYDLLHK